MIKMKQKEKDFMAWYPKVEVGELSKTELKAWLGISFPTLRKYTEIFKPIDAEYETPKITSDDLEGISKSMYPITPATLNRNAHQMEKFITEIHEIISAFRFHNEMSDNIRSMLTRCLYSLSGHRHNNVPEISIVKDLPEYYRIIKIMLSILSSEDKSNNKKREKGEKRYANIQRNG